MRATAERRARTRSRSVADLMTLMLDQKKDVARISRPEKVFRPFGFGRRRETETSPQPAGRKR